MPQAPIYSSGERAILLELPKLFSWSLLAEAGWRFSFEAGGYSPFECSMLRPNGAVQTHGGGFVAVSTFVRRPHTNTQRYTLPLAVFGQGQIRPPSLTS
jgi:hypothetical protein